MIKAVIFDIGGVVTVDDCRYLIIEDTAKSFNISFRLSEKIFAKFITPLEDGKISVYEFWKMFAKKCNRKISSNYRELLTKSHEKKSIVNLKIVKIAKTLKKKGYMIPVLSNSSKPHSDYNKERHLYDMFYPVILSDEVGMSKPKHAIYRLTLKKINLKPSECVFIDDHKCNIIAANKLGMKGIHFKDAERLRERLKNLGVVL